MIFSSRTKTVIFFGKHFKRPLEKNFEILRIFLQRPNSFWNSFSRASWSKIMDFWEIIFSSMFLKCFQWPKNLSLFYLEENVIFFSETKPRFFRKHFKGTPERKSWNFKNIFTKDFFKDLPAEYRGFLRIFFVKIFYEYFIKLFSMI